MILPFWFVDKSSLSYGSSSWTNPVISMQLYRYMLVMYRYNFTTVIFKQVVPVQVWVVPVLYVHCHFSSKLYRYKFGLYRYNMSTATFQASCTGTSLGCTGTICPLVLSLLFWSSRDFVNCSPTSTVLHIGFPGIHPCALTF